MLKIFVELEIYLMSKVNILLVVILSNDIKLVSKFRIL